MAVINLTKLLKELNENKKLTKKEKFAKVIDIAYKQLYGIKKESWENNIKKVNLLIEVGEEENWKTKELSIREATNIVFSNYRRK
jgi:hypothetical protein